MPVAPEAVRRALRHGLALWRDGHGGRGLELRTVIEAEELAQGRAPTREKIARARRWYTRNARFQLAPPRSPAHVAWLLWGGSAGRRWWASL